MANLTMGQFLINPTGKHSANVARRDRIRADLTSRFNKLYKERKKGFKLSLFKYPEDKVIVAWFKIPSEELNKSSLTYDVLMEFQYPPSALRLPHSANYNSLKSLDMKVFSNSPNFTFTYAYVFNKEGFIIEWMKKRMSQRSLNKEPVKRNPDQGFGFEKSIYFSILYFQKYCIKYPNLYMNEMSKTKLSSNILTANQKLTQNKDVKEDMKKKNVKRQNLSVLNPFSGLFSKSSTSQRTTSRNLTSKSTKKPLGSSSKKSKLGSITRKPLVNKLTRKKSTKHR